MSRVTSWLVNIIDKALPPKTDVFPKQLVDYQGASSETNILFPYGMYGNVSNDVLALMFFYGGNSENRIAIPGSFQVRPDLEQGEIAIFRPDGDAIIKFANSGNIEITTTADVTVNCANATVTASEDITASCVNATLTATTAATVDAPTITLDGNVTVTGTLQVDGVATLGSGGALIARLGDTVAVTIPNAQGGGGGLPGTGTITSGSPAGHTAS